MKLKTIAQIIKDQTDRDILTNHRTRELIELRSVANTYLRNEIKLGFNEIARQYKSLGKTSHHTTIMHSVNGYEINCKYNNHLKVIYDSLLDKNKGKNELIIKIRKLDKQNIKKISEFIDLYIDES